MDLCFHEWLPNGEGDAICINIGANAELKIWFDRRGYVDDGLIRFDYSRKEVDPKIMSKQAILEAGPLFALLRLDNMPEEDLVPLRERRTNGPTYIAFGKRIIELVYPIFSRFLNILRINYGQYWVSDLEKWDSRRRSLGNYCRAELFMEWSIDGATWSDFLPTEQVLSSTARFPSEESFQAYLAETDWREIARVMHEGYSPSLAAVMLARAHRFLDEGYLRQALVEGVSCLEIALEEFMRERIGSASILKKSLSSFWDLPLRTRIVSIAGTLGTKYLQGIEPTLKAIDNRNKVVHEGWTPPDTANVELRALLNSVARLLPGPSFRFPSSRAGNRLRPPESSPSAESSMS